MSYFCAWACHESKGTGVLDPGSLASINLTRSSHVNIHCMPSSDRMAQLAQRAETASILLAHADIISIKEPESLTLCSHDL